MLQALLDIKDSIKLPTSAQDSAPAPQADVVSFSKHLEKVGKSFGNTLFWENWKYPIGSKPFSKQIQNCRIFWTYRAI